MFSPKAGPGIIVTEFLDPWSTDFYRRITILYSSGLCIFCNLGRCDVMCRNRRRSLCEIPAREVHVVKDNEPERAIETYGTASSSEYTGSSEERSIRCRLRDGDRGKDVQVVPSPSTGKARRHLHISFRATTDIIFADTTTTTTIVIPACSGINNLQPYSSLLCGKRPERRPGRSAAKEADENVRTSRWRVEHMRIRFHKPPPSRFTFLQANDDDPVGWAYSFVLPRVWGLESGPHETFLAGRNANAAGRDAFDAWAKKANVARANGWLDEVRGLSAVRLEVVMLDVGWYLHGVLLYGASWIIELEAPYRSWHGTVRCDTARYGKVLYRMLSTRTIAKNKATQ
jgi:hypothetical protein